MFGGYGHATILYLNHLFGGLEKSKHNFSQSKSKEDLYSLDLVDIDKTDLIKRNNNNKA